MSLLRQCDPCLIHDLYLCGAGHSCLLHVVTVLLLIPVSVLQVISVLQVSLCYV